MNITVAKSKNNIIALIVFVSILVFSFLFFNQVSAIDNNTPGDKHLITIYDRGVEKVVLTDAKNIGDAIREADIDLEDKDRVEPARNEEIIAPEYQVNIYRARPVLIVDGVLRQRVITAYQTPEQIAKSVGIDLYAEDIATIGRVDNITEGFGEQLTITRATPIKLTLYGTTSDIRTQSKTVGDMLKEKSIKLSSADKIDSDLNKPISEGLSVKVWREGQQTITVKEPVDFDVEKIEDANRSVDYRFVKTAGEKGEKVVTYKITIIDGAEVSRREITSLVTKQSKKQVEVVGAMGKYNTPSENESITWSYLRAQGFSKIQTAGIMGNLMQEHGFNTTDTPGGLGIVQWTAGRRTNLIQRYPSSYETIYSQIDYLMYELNGGYAGVRDAIKNTNSLGDAVRIFQNQFERCGICRENQRIVYAQNILASHE